MSEIRKNLFLKELRRNREYMYFVHASMFNSRFMLFLCALCLIFTVAEYHTGGAFSGFVIAVLLYLLNYLAVLYTATPVFAMKGRILYKVVREEYVDYTVENSRTIRRVTSDKIHYNVGDEVYLYRFKPCFFFREDKTGMAASNPAAVRTPALLNSDNMERSLALHG